MAKKIKFPLKMKNGALVRTLEDLRENFDINSLLEQYESGRLLEWLEDRYYDIEVEKIQGLDRTASNFAQSLCNCLGIEVQEEALSDVDVDFLKRRVEKLEFLKRVTTDELLLSKVDDIAITQEDLIDLIGMGKGTIYLCNGDFTIPVSVPNMTYIGIYEPCAVVRATDNVNFKRQNIIFKDVPFIWDISGVSVWDKSYQAERMFMEGKYEEAKEVCLELMEENNPRAIMLLYHIYDSFLCNALEATKCKRKGMELNEAYSLLEDVKWKFIERYKKSLRKNAISGTSFDKYYYGLALYLWGSNNSDNYDEEMMTFYLESAKQGNAVVSCEIGHRYSSGQGVEQDYQRAMEWYLKAANQKSAIAQIRISVLYYDGDGVAQDDRKAMEWALKAAEQNYALGQEIVGECYYEGIGVSVNYQKAMEWFLKAASQNQAYAQFYMGNLYYYGRGTAQDYQKAREWYLKAAENGNTDAMEKLARCYQKGYGVPQDYAKALEWRKKAAVKGDLTSIANIGWHYRYGKGVQQDYSEAMKWFLKAAEKGEEYSQRNIGDLYYNGYGVSKDLQKAKAWYQKAADNGDSEAKEALKKF